jgi:hypothetical protein
MSKFEDLIAPVLYLMTALPIISGLLNLIGINLGIYTIVIPACLVCLFVIFILCNVIVLILNNEKKGH